MKILAHLFLKDEHKRAVGPDAALQQENSPALIAHSSRINFPADMSLMPAFRMFIETLKSEDQTMATQTLKLNVKTGEKDDKNFWDRCGVLFINTDDEGNITSVSLRLTLVSFIGGL